MTGLKSVTLTALALMVTLVGVPASVYGAEANVAKGSVKGKVINADGTPAAGAEVRLMVRPDRAARQAAREAARGEAKPEGVQGKAKGRARAAARDAVAQGTADLNGHFTLEDVAAGNYVLTARMKGAGNARQPVSVHGTNPSDVTLTLKERAAGAKPGKQGKAGRKQAKAARKQAKDAVEQ